MPRGLGIEVPNPRYLFSPPSVSLKAPRPCGGSASAAGSNLVAQLGVCLAERAASRTAKGQLEVRLPSRDAGYLMAEGRATEQLDKFREAFEADEAFHRVLVEVIKPFDRVASFSWLIQANLCSNLNEHESCTKRALYDDSTFCKLLVKVTNLYVIDSCFNLPLLDRPER